ncbi:MAG: type II secretion system protein N [Thermodesulfobacteriota bacterium]|nr:type II secretion system protein N [Thermodesulfobacteriota bacterium]
MTTRYRTIIILIVITILAYLSVDIFYRTIDAKLALVKTGITTVEKKPLPVVKRQSLGSYHVISERNLFGSINKSAGERYINVDELESTKLNLVLLGTVYGIGKLDCAVIEEKANNKQSLFRVGDAVASATLIRIMRGMVVLHVDGRDEVLAMEVKDDKNTAGVTERTVSGTGTSITVRKAEIDDAMKDMGKILTQARIRPYFSAGKSDGFIINRIKKGSIFQKMGMRNGDIIQGVDGQPIKSPDEMLKLYNGLKSGSAISLNIKRRGKEQNLEYVFQ